MARRAETSDANQAEGFIEVDVVAPRFRLVDAERIFGANLAGRHIDVFVCRAVAENAARFELRGSEDQRCETCWAGEGLPRRD